MEQCTETRHSVYSCVHQHHRSHFASFFLSLLSPCILPLTSLVVFILSSSSFLSTFTSPIFLLFYYYIIYFMNSIIFSFFLFSLFLTFIVSFFLYLTSYSFSSSHSSFILLPFCPFNIYPFFRYRSRCTYIFKQYSIQCN